MVDYHKQFIENILNISNNKSNYSEAIQEWEYYGETYYEEGGTCLCGHYIEERCIVHNKINKLSEEIGNCCIKKFGVHRANANKSIKNYLELCKIKAQSRWEQGFVDSLISNHKKYPTLFLSDKQVSILERIAGIKYRFKYWR